MTSYCYRLPWPPSINHYWQSFVPPGGRRAIVSVSTRGKQFRQEVCDAIYSAPMLMGRLAVCVELTPPNRMRRDIDNFCKVALDCLTHAGVWKDDEQIDELIVRRLAVEPPGCCDVTIVELEA